MGETPCKAVGSLILLPHQPSRLNVEDLFLDKGKTGGSLEWGTTGTNDHVGFTQKVARCML